MTTRLYVQCNSFEDQAEMEAAFNEATNLLRLYGVTGHIAVEHLKGPDGEPFMRLSGEAEETSHVYH